MRDGVVEGDFTLNVVEFLVAELAYDFDSVVSGMGNEGECVEGLVDNSVGVGNEEVLEAVLPVEDIAGEVGHGIGDGRYGEGKIERHTQ